MNTDISELFDVQPESPYDNLNHDESDNVNMPINDTAPDASIVTPDISSIKKPFRVSDYAISIHDDTFKILDKLLGEPYREKVGNQYTGKLVRRGEGKFLQSLLKLHEIQVKKNVRILKQFDRDIIYIMAFAFKSPYQEIATFEAFNTDIASFNAVYIIPNAIMGTQIKEKSLQILSLRDYLNLPKIPLRYITDWNA